MAPKHIDPKFFDPKHVFQDLSMSAPLDGEKPSTSLTQLNVFQPEKKRRNRAGYDENDRILFKKANAAEFIRCQDPVAFLGSVNKIAFETEEEKEWLAMDVTTADVKENCKDLKVLGKGDFKTLMKWRVALREEVCQPRLLTSHSLILLRRLVSKSRQSPQKSLRRQSR